MNTSPGIEELDNPAAYERVLALPYGEIAPFILSRITKPSLPMLLIWITTGAALFLSVWLWPGAKLQGEGTNILSGLAAGLLLLPILLIPVHEGTHLIPFWLSGARDIRFGADLRQGIVYVTAHRFVAGRKLFAIVALTPFITMTLSLLVLILLSPPWWKWVLSMTLLVHTTMCAGDTALLGYMCGFGNRKVFTWDDADRKEAYFYASKQKSEVG